MSRIYLFLGVIATVLNSASTHAQTSVNYSYVSTNHAYADLNKSIANAMKHFTSNYGDDTKENWSTKSDGYRATFRKDGVVHLVDYNKKGKLMSTIRIYNETVLPKNIRKIVKSTFYDFDIVSVAELSLSNNLVYFIKIQDETSLKTVRVIDNDMEVIEDFHRADR